MSNTREGRCRIAHWAAQADPVVSAQLAFELMTTDLRQAIGALTVPATVLYARDPAMGSAEEIDALWQSRSEEHTSELQSLMRISYAVFCLKKKKKKNAKMTHTKRTKRDTSNNRIQNRTMI